MKFYVCFLAILALAGLRQARVPAGILTEQEVESAFEQFKNDFSRSYPTPAIELHRKSIFRTNLHFIHNHNFNAPSNGINFRVGINNFTDMTNDEFRATLNILPPRFPSPTRTHTNASISGLPTSVDWVARGAVTPVINQGQCGSSWAIPVVAAVEGGHAIKSGKLVPLSIQQMIDCCTQDGDQGCNGGFMDDGYNCIIRLHGLDTAASYPYNGNGDESCHFNPKTIGSVIDGYVDLAHSEMNLQNAVALVGPIAAAIDASQSSFQFYTSGVYYEPACLQTPDHGVTVVGYGSESGNEFWKVKNSWGSTWGENGYIRMARNKGNMCGIANMASYPLILS